MVGNPINCLCVDDQLLLDNKIRNILAHQLPFIQHSMSLLLGVGDTAQAKLHAETILIDLFVQPMSAHVQNLDGATHYSIYLIL